MSETTGRRKFFDDIFEAFSMLAVGNDVSLYDVRERITRYSAGAVDRFGLPGEYIPDGAYDWVEYVHPDDRGRYRSVMEDLMACRALNYDLTYRVRLRDGSYAALRFIGAVLREEHGQADLVGGMMIDQGRAETVDPITVLRNQHGFLTDLRSMRDAKQPCVILMLGINGLSHLNRKYGYGYGNETLQQIGWLIQQEIGYEGISYRLDDAVFAVVFSGTQTEPARECFSRIRRILQVGIRVRGSNHSFVTNGAYFTVRDFSLNERTVLNNLRYGYSESKRRLHGRLVSLDNRADGTGGMTGLSLTDRIRTCMLDECQGFYLDYQEVTDVRTGRPAAVEALLRWRTEDGTPVLPMDFLPVLEQDIAFEELGIWILTNAMTDGLALVERDPACMIGVNISAFQMEDVYFLDTLSDIAEETGFPLSNLCLELNRDCRQLETDYLREKIRQLKELGVQILMDDFGSGYGSLELLRTIPVDLVKFDMQYVASLTENEKDRSALKHLAELVASQGVRVCIKGIEDVSLRDIVSGFSVDCMQGNYFGEPVSFPDLISRAGLL